jgi:hypothetical protein
VLKNAGAKKWRLDPLRGQCRNRRKLNGLNWRTDQRDMSSMIAVAGDDECDRTCVVGFVRIRMNAPMQLG